MRRTFSYSGAIENVEIPTADTEPVPADANIGGAAGFSNIGNVILGWLSMHRSQYSTCSKGNLKCPDVTSQRLSACISSEA